MNRYRLVILRTGKAILEVPPNTSAETAAAIGEAWKNFIKDEDLSLFMVAGEVVLESDITPEGELTLKVVE